MKEMKLIVSTVFLGLLCTFSTYGQDVHFSHMEQSPLTLSPGLTGVSSPLQVNVNYRSQWQSVASPYSTIAASVDARFNEKNKRKKGIIAAGVNFFNDQVGDLKVTSNNVNLNLAYHLILDRRSMLGLGIYTGLGQRSIGGTGERWGVQYDGTDYNESIATGETFASNNFTYFDAGAGLVYTYDNNEGRSNQNNQRYLNAGVGFYHVNQPSYSFINQSDEKLPLRWSIFVNSIIGFQNSSGALMPGVYFNRQKTNMEILYGTYYRMTLADNSDGGATFLALGLFHRWGDALVAKASLQWGPMSGGFAYDINISSLNLVSNARGGFEVFLKYSMLPGKGGRSKLF